MRNSECDCDSDLATEPTIDATVAGQSQRFFSSIRTDVYRCVRPQERDVLAMPWGPRIDVIFDPKSAPGIVGGSVRLMARTAGTEVELARMPVVDPKDPLLLYGEAGCDEYVVKASLGTDPGNVKRVESYVFARVYSGL